MNIKLIILFFKKNLTRSFFLLFIFFMLILTINFSLFITENSKNFFYQNSSNLDNPNKITIISNKKDTFFKKDDKNMKKFYEKIKKDKNIKSLKTYFFPKIPSTLNINFLWNKLETDIFLYSVEKIKKTPTNPLLNNEEEEIKKFREVEIPIAISKQFLQIYNLELAWNSFFPPLTKKTISGLPMKICLNKSSFFEIENNFCEKTKITELDPDAPLIWIVINNKYLDKKIFSKKIEKAKIIKIIAEVKNKNYIKRLELMNLASWVKIISYDKQKAEINKKMWFLNYIIWIISGIIIFSTILFLIYIIFSYFEIEKNIYNILFFDWIKKITIYKIGFSYFLSIFFIAFLLNIIFYLISSFYIIPYLSNLITEKIWIDFILVNISLKTFGIIAFSIFILLFFVYSIIFFRRK